MFFSMTLTLFLVMDVFGTIPMYLSLLHHFKKEERRKIAIRELLFSLGIMYIFFFIGRLLIRLLAVNLITVGIAGGVVLFLIASRLIFCKEVATENKWQPAAHFIVPIATPVIAGPSFLAALLIYSHQEINITSHVLASIFLVWLISAFIYFFAEPIYALLKEKGLGAFQRLMGLLVAVIAVEMILSGIHKILGH